MRITTLEAPLTLGGPTPIQPDFKIHTGAMEIDPQHDDVVTMIGSSTQRDLQGDTMSLDALTDMTKVEPGLAIWLNHVYTLPDSMFGCLLKSPGLSLQDGIADLKIMVRVEKTNPPAMQTLGYVGNGTKIGCSIGCIILEYEIDEENDDGRSWFPPLIIHHVQTLEWSVVGIPANQRCWVEPAAKGLFERSLSQGKGDEALRLAPIVRSLYPRAYQDKLKEIVDEGLRKDLERVQARPSSKQRIEWDPSAKTFLLNQRGSYTAMNRDEVTLFLKKSNEMPPRINPWIGSAKESTPGTMVKLVEGFDIDAALRGELNSGKSLDKTGHLIIKGASGKTDWPLADEDTSWDSSAAHKRIMDWAGGDDPDWSKVKSVHFWFDDEKADTWGGYKLPFTDVIGDSVKAVPKGVYAAAAAIQGARGGVDIPDSDVPAVKKKIEVYYHKLDKKAPWEEKEDGDKEDSTEPNKEADAEPMQVETKDPLDAIAEAEEQWDREHEFLLTASAEVESKEEVRVEPPDLLDVRLFNVLAERLGQPQVALNNDGTLQAKSQVNDATITEAIARALAVLDITKSGSEFSAKNKKALQDIHDGIVKMCKAQFHPCKEMQDDEEDDDGKKPEDEEDDDQEKSLEQIVTRVVAPLHEHLASFVEALSKHGLDPQMLKGMQRQSADLQRQFKETSARIKETRDQIAALRSLPLGQPTQFRRSIQGEEVATYDDFARLKSLPMNDNERTWTLVEALKSTTIIPRQVGDEIIHYRLWPEGVGGSVKDGVRPPLTGAQRSFMAPMDAVAYIDGHEAAVPLYDDPGGVSM